MGNTPSELVTDVQVIRAELLHKMHDPSYLPSRQEVLQAFPDPLILEAEELQSGDHYEQWIRDFCDADPNNKIFELFTQEYIRELATFLLHKAEMRYRKGTPMKLLEVGAGNGKLSYFLSKELTKRKGRLPFQITATDNGSFNISQIFPVEKMDYRYALEEIEPTDVICSWMPRGMDWSKDFRQHMSVQQYILIGNIEVTGLVYETWGVDETNYFHPRPAPYLQDGFQRIITPELTHLNTLQLCRLSSLPNGGNSMTASFQRTD